MRRSKEPAGRAGENEAAFDAFFVESLPVVYGYVLRLCGGDTDEAWDCVQEAWLTMARELRRGANEVPSVGWLIRVARSRYLDRWRRQHRLEGKLALVWAADRDREVQPDVTREVIPWLVSLESSHRVVLTLFYVDDLDVTEVGRLMGLSRSSTYALLDRARTELRQRWTEADRA